MFIKRYINAQNIITIFILCNLYLILNHAEIFSKNKNFYFSNHKNKFLQVDTSITNNDSTKINPFNQENIYQDNSKVNLSLQDTIQNIDTTKPKSFDVDSVIYSSAKDSIIFNIKERKMNIYGSGHVNYKTTELKSGQINIDFVTSDVIASGIINDSTKELVETPTMIEAGEEYFGNQMTYNFKTTRGFITFAKTEAEEGIYSGSKIKKVNKNTFFVAKGIYTTCDAEEPHYYFYGEQMKVVQKQQVIGRWIWLTIGDVPFPIPVPFAVFPLQSGRRSGIIAPAYGQRPEYGFYFSHLGYFWAINDYLDWNITTDIYTRGSYALDSRFRYNKRYSYSGSIEGSYSDYKIGDEGDPGQSETKDWHLKLYHNQTLTPSSRLNASLEYSSSNYLRENITDYNQLLRNDIFSSASYYKNWEESGSTLQLSYRRRQEIQTGNIDEILPSLSFSKTRFYPFKRKGFYREDKWYELIGIDYTGQFQNNRNKIKGDLNIRGGINHNIRISASPKIGFFNISPYLNYQEKWYNKYVKKESIISPYTNTDSVITNDVKDINFVRTFDLGISASTKIYGIFHPNIFRISGIRHILQPSITYNYRPDFSTKSWGYYDSYKLSDGREMKYDRYEREIFGGVSAGESQNINFSVSNNFEMKIAADPSDTTSKEKKIQLLNLSASLNYNIAADSFNFSPLNLSYYTKAGDFLSLNGITSFSLYDYKEGIGTVNQFLVDNGKGLLRLLNFNIALSTSLSGEKIKSLMGEEEKQTQEDTTNVFNQNNYYSGIYDTKEPDFSIPWSLTLNLNYNLDKSNPYQTRKFANISTGIDFNLTKNWKFQVSGSYDLINKQISAPLVNITRDLHCWIMTFTWHPMGLYRGYHFEIRVKAPNLQDLKLTKSYGFMSGRR